MVAFLASDDAANVNGQIFLCAGTSISLLSQPRPVKTHLRKDAGRSTSSTRSCRDTLMDGSANPAPREEQSRARAKA